MAYDFSNFKTKLKETREWLSNELSKLRTGRATAAILDDVTVESYGSQVPLAQVAQVGNEDPRTLRVVPYDGSQTQAVEKAIVTADLGVSVSASESGIRVAFPELTAETRKNVLDRAKSKLEDARVSVRAERDEVWGDIQKKEQAGDISEDDKFRFKQEMEKLVEETNRELEEMYEKKEKEIKN